MKPGPPARFDYEYERNGPANLLMMLAPLEGWRHVKVTDRHPAVDYAHVLKDLADAHFSNAKTIVLVQDMLVERPSCRCEKKASEKGKIRASPSNQSCV